MDEIYQETNHNYFKNLRETEGRQNCLHSLHLNQCQQLQTYG